MDQLKQQVAEARRRLLVQQFLGVLPWCCFATLLAAVVALGAQKWLLPTMDGWRWMGGCLVGALALGILAALIWTSITRRGQFDAALEIDRRFGLKERISTTLALTADELNSPCGQALVEDAMHRVSRLDITGRFPVTAPRHLLLLLAPIAAAIALCLLPFPSSVTRAGADVDRAVVEKQIEESIKPLEKKVEQRSRQAKENSLSAVAELLKKIADEIHGLTKHDQTDRHEALAKLHDLMQELDHRSEQLVEQAKITQYLAAMNNIPSGPADKLAQEFTNGNFENALAELQQLQDKLSHGQLNAKQLAELAQQMAAMSEALRKTFEQHQPRHEELQRQLAAAKQSGDRQAQQRLEQHLAKLDKQQPAIEAIREFADQFAECAKSAQSHDMKQTLAALSQLAAQFGQIQQQSQEMEMIEATLGDIDGAKMAMSGKQAGTEADAKFPDRSAGSEGIGHREAGAGVVPETVHATTYDSVVQPQTSGRAAETAAGPADGPNVKGQALAQIKAEMQASRTESAEPISSEMLPRAQRDQVQQYFDAFRRGQ